MGAEDEILFRDRVAALRRRHALELEKEAKTVMQFGMESKNQTQQAFWFVALKELDRMILSANKDANAIEKLSSVRQDTMPKPSTALIVTKLQQEPLIVPVSRELSVMPRKKWWGIKIPGPLELLGLKKKT